MTVYPLPDALVVDTPRQFQNRQTVVNQVTVTYGTWGADDRPSVHARDDTSVERHGPSKQTIDTELVDSADAQALADTIVAARADPLTGLDLTLLLTAPALDVHGDPAEAADVWAGVCELIGGPTVTFERADLVTTTPRTWTREQQQLTWTPNGWTVDMSLLTDPDGES